MKNKQKLLNGIAAALALLLVAALIWGCSRGGGNDSTPIEDGIESVDLDSIFLDAGGTEVNFTDVILSPQNEMRRLIVSTQTGTVTTKLTDRLIKELDFDFLQKTQNVSYTGTGYFVVDLHDLTTAHVVVNKAAKTVTLRISHAYLQAIEIDPNQIIIDEVKESLLARGDIKLTVADYNTIEKELRSRLEAQFSTPSTRQAADSIALRMVKEIYEPLVKAVDSRYSVMVEFR